MCTCNGDLVPVFYHIVIVSMFCCNVECDLPKLHVSHKIQGFFSSDVVINLSKHTLSLSDWQKGFILSQKSKVYL